MKISKNKVVSLSYELRVDGKDGEIVETVDVNNPFIFIFGVDGMIPGFERNLENLQAGDNFAFLLDCEDAYGPAFDEALVEIPKTTFFVDGEIDNDMFFEGNTIPMMDSRGNRHDGVVFEVKDDTVVMDFNHPLAGDSLYFSGTVIDVREPTQEELDRSQSNCSQSSCQGCGGGCS